LTQVKVIFKHAFRNSLLPLVTVIGLSLGGLLGGGAHRNDFRTFRRWRTLYSHYGECGIVQRSW
jgi:hypothetical protein